MSFPAASMAMNLKRMLADVGVGEVRLVEHDDQQIVVRNERGIVQVGVDGPFEPERLKPLGLRVAPWGPAGTV